ncbi:MAG: hypothetical protein COZ29_00995 [Candidatus Moranbacteria bacterium CG_4_10_14_3_um_filter_45_9]|nr:MAG: hypothetical protein AUK19_03105 [Candidatus Moranbacteria bacterium CG2_30_45_14]PIX90247.1 MAG: hypothetical protein COZ29_00995 [Candidatus Moranbacteria bacterium CG_4_10_14_3_um_filter_45_9]PJA85064.1 MAG: hypothetical protein CO143_03185 [Candidatus Moranbacteria bacterium CG_4_9_14_3_um_filter_45_14]
MRHRSLKAKKLLDYWSMPHFLFGTVSALFAVTFSLSVVYMFFVTLCLAIFWELLEMRFRLRETKGNSSMDVLLSLLSFGITFILVDRIDANIQNHGSLLIVTSILFLCLNFFAWRARFEHDGEFQG